MNNLLKVAEHMLDNENLDVDLLTSHSLIVYGIEHLGVTLSYDEGKKVLDVCGDWKLKLKNGSFNSKDYIAIVEKPLLKNSKFSLTDNQLIKIKKKLNKKTELILQGRALFKLDYYQCKDYLNITNSTFHSPTCQLAKF